MRHVLKNNPSKKAIAAILFAALTASSETSFRPGVVLADTRRTEIARNNARLTIDAVLNEPEWSEAKPIGEIIQRGPRPGEKPTEQTEVKVIYDSANLYIGVMCYDSEPARIVATQMARDAGLSADDRIEILIDSFHDLRNAFYFSTNPTSSRTYGADLHLFTPRFLGKDQNFGVDLFGLKSANEGVTGKDVSYGFSARYPNDLWTLGVDWRHAGKDFEPALGFVPRSNVNKLAISAEFDPRPKDFLNVRQMFHECFYTRFTRLDKGQVESWRLFTAPINYELNSGEHIEFNYAPQFERLFEPFEIAEGLILPPGDYRFTRWRAELNIASKRPWKADLTWWFGTYWSGHADELSTAFQYKLARRFQVSAALNQTFARLTEGNFVARVISLRADYSVSPFLTFFNLVQFDNESKNLGRQSRVRWILRPGNEVFIVFNQGWLQDERGGFHFRATDTRLAGKIQYTLRF